MNFCIIFSIVLQVLFSGDGGVISDGDGGVISDNETMDVDECKCQRSKDYEDRSCLYKDTCSCANGSAELYKEAIGIYKTASGEWNDRAAILIAVTIGIFTIILSGLGIMATYYHFRQTKKIKDLAMEKFGVLLNELSEQYKIDMGKRIEEIEKVAKEDMEKSTSSSEKISQLEKSHDEAVKEFYDRLKNEI